MAGIYYDFASILSNAGCKVGVNSINAGWERRARSSGGFPSPPLAVWWHHTASKTSVEGDLTWQCHTCPDGPVGNMLLARDGTFWPVAGGASNCAGKGGPASFSRGTVPLDSGNTRGFQIECANNGVGEPYPQAQIDAYFRGSNALNAFVGNQPTDIITHNVWAPTRKIDPATSAAVQGPWRPRSSTSSGTWNLDDIKAECLRRAGAGPTPVPPPEEDDMTDEQARQLQELYQAMCSVQPGVTDPQGNPLNAAWAALLGYSQTAELHQAMMTPQPGFVDPQGNPLNAAWAALWGENLVAGDIYKMLVDIQTRVTALESK